MKMDVLLIELTISLLAYNSYYIFPPIKIIFFSTL